MLSKSILFMNPFNFWIKRVQNLYFSTISDKIVKRIEFKTCGKLYDKLKATNPRLYQRSPSDGLPVSVEYVDTFANKKRSNSGAVKTIVAIHGIPGYYNHFNGLFEYFGGQECKVRVIAPNMPHFRLTRQTMAFWHSNVEKTQFIRDFLKAINVSKVDCLIGHSAAIHPISRIWSKPEELTIGSVCLFSPQCLWAPISYFGWFPFLSKFTETRVGIKCMDIIRPHKLAQLFGFRVPFTTVDEFMETSLMIHLNANKSKLHKKLEYLKHHKIRTLVVNGERDKLIINGNFEALVRDLGANYKDFVRFLSNDNRREYDFPESDQWIQVLTFEDGGHMTHNKFSDIVNRYIVTHLLCQ